MDDYLSKPLRARHLKKILEARFVLDADKAIITKIPIATPKEAADIPVDMEQLRLFTNDDPEEEKALIALFLEQAKAMISILQKSTGADDHEAWRSAAHRLKGSSGNLGAMKLHSICKHAETNCKDIEPKKNEMLAAIKEEALRVEQFLPI
jgi:two-component system, sensor histidine kinase and response regulator